MLKKKKCATKKGRVATSGKKCSNCGKSIHASSLKINPKRKVCKTCAENVRFYSKREIKWLQNL